jgi:hypothetical protein
MILHKYGIGFQPPKGDAARAVEPYLRNGKTDRVRKAASLVLAVRWGVPAALEEGR